MHKMQVWDDPILVKAMETEYHQMCVEELFDKNPKKVTEAATELNKFIKDESLRKEIALVSAIAVQRKSLGELNKKKKEILDGWNKDEIAKHRDEFERVRRNQPIAASELNKLESQRTMSNEELKNKLLKAG